MKPIATKTTRMRNRNKNLPFTTILTLLLFLMTLKATKIAELSFETFAIQHLLTEYSPYFFHKPGYSVVNMIDYIHLSPGFDHSLDTVKLKFNHKTAKFETIDFGLVEKKTEPQLKVSRTKNLSKIMDCAFDSNGCFLMLDASDRTWPEQMIYYFDIDKPQSFTLVYNNSASREGKKVAHLAAIDGSKYSIVGFTTKFSFVKEFKTENEDQYYMLVRTSSPDSPDFKNLSFYGFYLSTPRTEPVKNHDVMHIPKSRYVISVFNDITYIHDFTRTETNNNNNIPFKTYKNGVLNKDKYDPKLGFLDLSEKVIWADWYMDREDGLSIAIIRIEVFDPWSSFTVKAGADIRPSDSISSWQVERRVSTIPGSDFYAVPGYREVIIAKYTPASPMVIIFQTSLGGIGVDEVSFMDSAGLFIIGHYFSQHKIGPTSHRALRFGYTASLKNPSCGSQETPKYSFSNLGCSLCSSNAVFYKGRCVLNMGKTERYPFYASSVPQNLGNNAQPDDFEKSSSNSTSRATTNSSSKNNDAEVALRIAIGLFGCFVWIGCSVYCAYKCPKKRRGRSSSRSRRVTNSSSSSRSETNSNNNRNQRTNGGHNGASIEVINPNRAAEPEISNIQRQSQQRQNHLPPISIHHPVPLPRSSPRLGPGIRPRSRQGRDPRRKSINEQKISS